MNIREKIFELIDKDSSTNKWSSVYELFMLVVIIASIVPLMFFEESHLFLVLEKVTVSIFIIDYLLRWLTADYRLGKGKASFFLYPVTPMAIIDLLSILPGLTALNDAFKLFRMTRLFRLFRLLKLLRYSSKVLVLWTVIKKEKRVLLSVLIVSLFYVFITALLMFNVEPHINPTTGEETFHSFFDALYWATVTLTTVGYGDLCPVTEFGRCISMLSSLFGVAIIALPSGVITASYLDELKKSSEKKEK